MECYVCGNEMVHCKTDVDTGWGEHEITVHNFPAYKCPQCGEVIFNGTDSLTLMKACKAFSDVLDKEMAKLKD